MGSNSNGQLGDGTTTDRSSPILIESSGVVAISADNTSFYIKSDGSLWGMGSNSYNQLGDGTTINSRTPIQIKSSDVVSVSSGSNNTRFIMSSGSLWAMGWNYNGAIPGGTTPERVESSGATIVSAGPQNTLFLKNDSSLWGFGLNHWGELGDGTTYRRSTPIQIIPAGVIDLSTRCRNSLFIKSDGSLWGMGYNYFGQLGVGTTDQHIIPVQIEADSVTQVSVNWYNSMYIKNDGSLWAMGSNYYGQYGNGKSTILPSPVPFTLFNSTFLTLNTGVGGDATGGGVFENNQTVTVTATPDSGYLFGNWNGTVASTSSNPTTVDMSVNREVTPPSFRTPQTTMGTDLPITTSCNLRSDPNDTDTDDDGFTDDIEIQYGLDPNVADTALLHTSAVLKLPPVPMGIPVEYPGAQ